MDEQTKALVEQYDKDKKKTLKTVLLIALIVLGAALIITAALFRTQYPLLLEDKGQLHYSYSHILLRDATRYNAFNAVTRHEVKYYIVYRNASIYYEQETNFATYSAHASKENVQPGITNHSVIQTSVERYTYLARDGRTYCYEKPVGKLKVLFDASYAEGWIFARFACYVCGAVLIVLSAVKLKKHISSNPAKEKNDEKN